MKTIPYTVLKTIMMLVIFLSPLFSQTTTFRINAAGGSDYTDTEGNLWVADRAYVEGDYGYVGGNQKTYDREIAGTEDDSLYLHLRNHSDEFSYVFDDVEDGTYQISLLFIEPEDNGAGDRLFDVLIEGQALLDNYDIYEVAGDTFTAVIEVVNVSITDGQLNIDFISLADKVLVCAIAVEPSNPTDETTYVDVAEGVGIVLSHQIDPDLCAPPISTGSAWADFDNDGDIDFYVTNHGGSNRLYQNDGDMDGDALPNYSEVALTYGVDISDLPSLGATFIDYDNDGDQDLFVTNWNMNILFQNQLTESGTVSFLDVTDVAGLADNGRGITAAWADFDQDGYLDVYIAKHLMCAPDDPSNIDPLFHNNGDGTFTEVGEWLCQDDGTCPQELGLGFSPGWVDYDNDGDLDLYLVNDYLTVDWYSNVLWRNDGSDGAGGWIFTDVSEESGSNIFLNGMGLGIGDYNRDGFYDFAFSNVGPNHLLRNNADGTFTDVANEAGTQRTLTPEGDVAITWGTTFLDYDNDGWEDLFFVAGNIGPLEIPQPNAFFRNNGDGTFDDHSAISGLDSERRGRAASVCDFDGDGYLDVFVGNFSEAPQLFRNKSGEFGNENHWVSVTVEGTVSNRDGIGSRIYISTQDGVTQMRDISSGPTHGGGDYRAAHFGVGQATSAVLSVRWPNGFVEEFGSVLSNQQVHVVENSTLSAAYLDVTSATGLNLSHQLDPDCSAPPIGSGSAWADYDNDGDLDVYFTIQDGANRLFENKGDTNGDEYPDFVDVADSRGVTAISRSSQSCVFIDYDNDGDQDLYVTHYAGNTLYKNVLVEVGTPSYVDVTDIAGVADNGRGITSAWADFDGDGYLDFYVAKHFLCMPDFPENHDPLFHNNGDGTFTNVSSWLCRDDGVCPQDEGLGFAPGWFDFDNDGDLDLYVANDILDGWWSNILWRNDGSDGMGGWTFTDVSEASGAGITANAMGLGLGDYDNDGWIDLTFTNGGPNYLLNNNGDGTFDDVSEFAGIQREITPSGNSSVTWGSVFLDYNNDSWLDLYYVSGKIQDSVFPQENALFLNNMDGTFTDASLTSGVDDEGRGRSASVADFNGDGYVDILLGNYGQDGRLFINNGPETGNTNHWLTITVEGTVSNRDAIGTRLWLSTDDGTTRLREINSGPTHGGGDHRAAYFGLGEHTSGELTIQWPTGVVLEYGTVDADQALHIIEDQPVGVEDGDEVIAYEYQLSQNYPNPFNPTTEFGFQVADFGLTSIKIFDIQGRLVKTVVDKQMAPGRYSAQWDGTSDAGGPVASGVYFYRFTVRHQGKATNAFSQTRKMLLTK